MTKVHIIGIPGSGKTTLARAIGAACSAPVFDLDFIVYGESGERPEPDIVRRLSEIRHAGGWVTEGAYHAPWVRTLLDDADAIAWLDVPWRTCVLRMVKRHARAEVARSNPHPGWRKLARFINYTRSTHNRQRSETSALLRPYSTKVSHCRSSRDSDAFLERVTARPINARSSP